VNQVLRGAGSELRLDRAIGGFEELRESPLGASLHA
jgi:hypothetical protein